MNAPRLAPPPRWTTHSPVGHLPGLMRDPLGLLDEAHGRYGDIVAMRILTEDLVSVADPEAVQRVLVSNLGNYAKATTPGYRVLGLLLGNGLVNAEGEAWKRQRRIANPAFHRRCLAGFADTMNVAAAEACEAWAGAGEGSRDLARDMTDLTLRIAGETLFHVDLSDESEGLARTVGTLLEGFDRLVTNPVPGFHRVPTPSNRRFHAARDEMDRVVLGIIEGRRASGEQEADLLGMLMDSVDDETGAGLTPGELRDEVVTMLLAGHETTANALAWTLWLLGQHPDVAARAAAEVQRVSPAGPVDFAALGELAYLRQVLHEALRMYPPVWLIERRVLADDALGGFRVKAGQIVMVSPWVIHRSPRLWPEPARFDPDRFAPEARQGRHPNAWMPFSVGARKCIGDRFAETEALIILSHMLRRFHVALDPGHVPGFDTMVTLRPRGGVRGRLVLR